MTENKTNPLKSIPVLKDLNWKHIVTLVVALLLTIGAYVGVNQIVQSLPIIIAGTNPIINVPDNTSLPAGTDAAPVLTPEAVIPPSNLPQPWDGASRVNILVMGLDFADWSNRSGPSRTDTMVLLSVDPITKTASMVSIPRDLWVEIPGYGYGRINTAHAIGQANKLPGGGPAMAAKTVEQFLGIPVQYYAVITFDAFTRAVDEIGCIQIWAFEDLRVDPVGPGNTIYLTKDKGYCMDGATLLAYARNRYTEGGDVDRAKRTQQVILALKDAVLDPAKFPGLVAKAPALYKELASGITTNLTLDDALKLAALMQQVDSKKINQGIINYEMSNLTKTSDGASVLLPIPDKIREMRDKFFADGSSIGPVAKGDLVQLMKDEGATVAVWNGTNIPDYATTTADYLKAQGVNVVEVGNPPDGVYARSKIINQTGKLYIVNYLFDLLKVDVSKSPSQYEIKANPAATADVIFILGNDWVIPTP
jgi:polyisoprenyl-teichoic acid--peptidoglycan teichoic acid transferase